LFGSLLELTPKDEAEAVGGDVKSAIDIATE
jgi:hypothetical protein